MVQVLSLTLPFFGLIFLGYIAGKIKRLPEDGLAWLNTFVLYVALPALFFQLLSQTPFDELKNLSFIVATTFITFFIFVLAFFVGMLATKGQINNATIQALAGSYSNIGYMGPGLTIGIFGTAAAVPTALIFCFDNILLFTLAPLLMAISGYDQRSLFETIYDIVVKKVLCHPFILATIAGVLAAYFNFTPPTAIYSLLELLKNAAAPCALFSIGVTLALQPVNRFAYELPILLILKLIIHPILIFVLLSWLGDFDPIWVKTAVLMACLPPATNVYVLARQYNSYIDRSSSTILFGTIISILTATIFIFFITESPLFEHLSQQVPEFIDNFFD